MGKREEEEVKKERKPGPLHDSGSSLKASLFHPGHNADDYFMLTLGEDPLRSYGYSPKVAKKLHAWLGKYLNWAAQARARGKK